MDRSEAIVYALAVGLSAVQDAVENHGRAIGLLMLVLPGLRLFRGLQNWMDRQDPKLVDAPLTRDRYLYFEDPPDGP
jgi:hypothetical protein